MRQTIIDSLVNAHLPAKGPGVAIGVKQGNKLLHCQGYGLASLEWNIPIEPTTVFRIASLTKQFTAMGILILQMQGKLHIEDRLAIYLPDCIPAWQDIRLKHLLTHTSGLANVGELPAYQQRATQHLTLEEMIELFKPQPLLFAPGTDFCYGNSGYHLLGLVIERVTHMHYEEFYSCSHLRATRHAALLLPVPDTHYP